MLNEPFYIHLSAFHLCFSSKSLNFKERDTKDFAEPEFLKFTDFIWTQIFDGGEEEIYSKKFQPLERLIARWRAEAKLIKIQNLNFAWSEGWKLRDSERVSCLQKCADELEKFL